MRKILIIIGLFVSLAGYGQNIVNKRVMLDSITAIRNALSGYLSAEDAALLEARIDSLVGVMGDTIPISTIAPLLVDTIPLFVFGAGGGNAVDTLCFTTSTIYGSFYNAGSDTLRVTELRCIMGHGLGLDTLGVQVLWHATFKSGAAVTLNAAALPVGRPNGITTGTTDTSFAVSKIPPGVWVWCTTPYVPADALKRKPVYLAVQISGYKIPKY